MRPVLATLAGAGLRVGEAVALDWRDINLPTGTLTVGDAKTDAGTYRAADLPGGLIEALSEWLGTAFRLGSSPRTGYRRTIRSG
jgi:integrase